MTNKRTRQRNKWTTAQLREKLQEQVYFLEASSQAMDMGVIFEASRIAATIRLLLHQTSASHSLLGQMGVIGKMQFVDHSISNRNFFNDGVFDIWLEVELEDGTVRTVPVTPQNGLAEIEVLSGIRTYIPAFKSPRTTPRFVAFDYWWNEKFIDFPNLEKISRRDLILEAANRDGGSHIDPRGTSADYARFRKFGHGMFWSNTVGESAATPVEGDAVACSIRNIAYELLSTLETYGLK